MRCSSRRKESDIRPEQKWDFIVSTHLAKSWDVTNNLIQSLNDFKSTSCFTPFAYGYLWLSLIISIAVYGVDTFTAVNLLAFDRWSSEVEPYIPFRVSKWIFSACIIASWVNLGYEYVRALRVMKRGAVAESYLDSLAVRLESIRMGKNGRGWRRFLVFAELTKSKKGAEYVALFTYFAFQCKSCFQPQNPIPNNHSMDSNHLLSRSTTSCECFHIILSLSSKPRTHNGKGRWIGSQPILPEYWYPCKQTTSASRHSWWHALYSHSLDFRCIVPDPRSDLLPNLHLALHPKS